MKIINPDSVPPKKEIFTIESYEKKLLELQKKLTSTIDRENPEKSKTEWDKVIDEIVVTTIRAVLDTNKEPEIVEEILKPKFLYNYASFTSNPRISREQEEWAMDVIRRIREGVDHKK